MPYLFGKQWTRAELLSHIGDIRQLAEVRMSELNDGAGRGVRFALFHNSSGLAFSVMLDRGADLFDATYKGIPLAWQSAAGVRHPAYYEPIGTGWLRNFPGGLLTTCGLTNVGLPGSDALGEFGLHGRISNQPCQLHGSGGRWIDDDFELWLEASVRESEMFGFDLQLTRRLTVRLGEPELRITDRVENFGNREAPCMLLYHCNFGFPLIAKNSRLLLPQQTVTPRDAAASTGVVTHLIIEAPQSDYQEQVFFHQLRAGEHGMVTAAVVNDALQIAAYISYRQAELPYLTQWKQLGKGAYVLGLEPGNCLVMGRQQEREAGRLRMLAPGESFETSLQIGVKSGQQEIAALAGMILASTQPPTD